MYKIVAWSVQHRAATAFLAFLALLAGGWIARDVPLDVFPEFVPAQVSIQAEAPGFTPDQVETLVTRPIEAAVNGAQALAALRSESIPGFPPFHSTSTDGTDPQRAHQDIAERLRAAARCRPGAGTPKLSPLTSSTMDVLKLGLVSDKLDRFALRDLADWSLKPQLLAVPGVARVNVFGGDVRQLKIQPDLPKLEAYGFTLVELADAARAALALRGAGFVDLEAQRVLIESPVPAPDPAVLAAAVVTVRSGVPLRIGDFASVELSARCARATRWSKAATEYCSRSRASSAQTRSTSRGRSRPRSRTSCRGSRRRGISVYPALHRPATFIERALGNLRDGLALAAVIVLVVLFAFLRDVRAALISFITIPLSLVAATLVLDRFRIHPQRDDARRLRGRDRRARRRRDHRRREHHAPLARERVARRPEAARRRRARRVARDPLARDLRDARGGRPVRAGVLHLGRAGRVHRPARARIHRGRARVARDGAHRDARPRRTAVAVASLRSPRG